MIKNAFIKNINRAGNINTYKIVLKLFILYHGPPLNGLMPPQERGACFCSTVLCGLGPQVDVARATTAHGRAWQGVDGGAETWMAVEGGGEAKLGKAKRPKSLLRERG